jgi:hypothetical protein
MLRNVKNVFEKYAAIYCDTSNFNVAFGVSNMSQRNSRRDTGVYNSVADLDGMGTIFHGKPDLRERFSGVLQFLSFFFFC